MDYLQLAQAVARESGTLSGTQPSSVVSQTGRLLKIVTWTKDAWTLIQNSEASWRWMREEFPATAITVSGTARYTPASWSITDLAEWITESGTLSLYKQSLGVSDESEIRQIGWTKWRQLYDRGSQTNNRPQRYAISPAGEICFGPIPDAAYVVNGEYRQTPQELSANTDEPNLPSRFHMVIVWRAIMLLGENDEAEPFYISRAKAKYEEMMHSLRRDQLPRIIIGAAPLA